MKAVVLAYHNIGCAGIKALLKHGFDIQAIFTHKDDQNEKIWFDSVVELAVEYDIPVYAPEDINHPLWVDRIKDIAPEILFSFYYRSMIGSGILNIPTLGCLNLHGSLLPKYRGRCPVNWAIVNGEKETGVTLHYMTPKPDDGAIIGQEHVDITDTDTALSLHNKLKVAAAELLKNTLDLILSNSVSTLAQNHLTATYYSGRTPADGEIDWRQSNVRIYDLVRAVARPYPGAFSYLGNKKILFWAVEKIEGQKGVSPGTVLSLNPLTVNCGEGAVIIKAGQAETDLYMSGNQLAKDLGLAKGSRFDKKKCLIHKKSRKKHVLILGADGFIGNHLSERLLDSDRYEVHALDLCNKSLGRLMGTPGFHFREGDISIHREWIEYHVRKCDIILPLVAIATPAEYVRNPLRVFELDFEENLRIVRYCAKYRKRIIFPSTSEVYGMCEEDEFDEEHSKLVVGPIHKQRWIYSCSKQLLDRVIWAYGATKELQFTLIRPFNWIGPRLDNLESARIGSSRVITKLILNLVEGSPIKLVDGGNQKRCFTDVTDGIDCLFKIIENENNCCDSRIFNIGSPENEASIKELANLLTKKFEHHPLRQNFPPLAGIQSVESKEFYGRGYEDVQHRRPSIKLARQLLNWNPTVSLDQSVEETLDYFLRQALEKPIQ